MKEKLLSLAVSVYNMEQDLNRCLDSVLLPAVRDKIEVIVVNDGSTDGSLAIAESYSVRFPQSVVLIDKPNGGSGSCRNAALARATGKYFKILDADDWFDSNAFIRFVEMLEKTDVDMVLTNYSFEYNNRPDKIMAQADKIIAERQEYSIECVNFREKCLTYLLTMHAMTYRTALLRDGHLNFSEGISYTDTEYLFYPLEYAHSFVYCNIVLYKYYIGRDGQSVSVSSTAKNKTHIYKIVSKLFEYLRDVQENKKRTSDNQMIIFEHAVILFYEIILTRNKKNTEDDGTIKELDKKLKTLNYQSYVNIGKKATRLKIPYVKLWRMTGIYFSEIKFLKLMEWVYLRMKSF